MANDDFASVAGKLLLRCEKLGPNLARDIVRNCFRDIVQLRQWSWLTGRAQLTTVNAYEVGTAAITYGDNVVTLTGGTVSVDHIGRQFRTGLASPILTITNVDVGLNTYTLDQDWTGTGGSGLGYSVYLAYLFMPSDFSAFISVVDPANYWDVKTDGVTVEALDMRDPQRSIFGAPARVLVPYDFYNDLPRYEIWPHQKSQQFYLMAYEKTAIDPFDAGATIPTRLPSDIILERALMYAARWPGPTKQDPNPYYSETMAQFHKSEYERRIAVIEKQDNELFQKDIWYQSDQGRHGIISSNWMQQHDLNPW